MRKFFQSLHAQLSPAVSLRAQPTTKQELGFTERVSRAYSLLLSRAHVSYQHLDLSVIVHSQLHAAGFPGRKVECCFPFFFFFPRSNTFLKTLNLLSCRKSGLALGLWDLLWWWKKKSQVIKEQNDLFQIGWAGEATLSNKLRPKGREKIRVRVSRKMGQCMQRSCGWAGLVL